MISPGATSTAAEGINDRGDIVGIYFDNTGPLHGFLQKNGALTTIDVPGAILAFPFEINDRGQIVESISLRTRNTGQSTIHYH